MKKTLLILAGVLFGSLSCVGPGFPGDSSGVKDPLAFDRIVYPESMGGFVTTFGLSELLSDGWQPFAEPTFIGVGYLQRLGVDPLELELAFNYNHDVVESGSSPKERLRFFVVDLGLGVAVPLTKSKDNVLEPYAGIGLAFMFARRDEEVGLEVEHFKGGDQGYYMHAGVRMHIEGGQYLSVDWRWLRDVEVDLGRGLQSAEANTLSIGFGYSF